MTQRNNKVKITLLIAIIATLISVAHIPIAKAEYGDIVLDNYSAKSGIRPVIFPHWFHRIRFSCKTCHSDLGFKMKAGANKINMLKIINGEYCGACHNGQVAWSVENCDFCHSAKKNMPTEVIREHMIKLKTGK